MTITSDQYSFWVHGFTIGYYCICAIALVMSGVRILFGWFRDYDNSVRFSRDMATQHLPYIQRSLQAIATQLGVELEPAPPINYSKDNVQA